jgi:hypothetical protein
MEQQYIKVKDDLSRLIDYRFEIFKQPLVGYEQNLKRQINFIIAQKETYTKEFYNSYILANPKNRCNDGNARVWLDGKPTTLNYIKKGSRFMIEDNTATLIVECLETKLN